MAWPHKSYSSHLSYWSQAASPERLPAIPIGSGVTGPVVPRPVVGPIVPRPVRGPIVRRPVIVGAPIGPVVAIRRPIVARGVGIIHRAGVHRVKGGVQRLTQPARLRLLRGDGHERQGNG